jgi:two-component system CheB/CheR fusion protein
MARKSNPPEPPSGPPLTHGRVTAVVGIGASAGGLEAFDELLRNLPTGTGMAYIFVQHLDPRHHSQLSELLGRATPLRVQDATQSMLIEPDHVYVIRPGTVLSVRGGALQVTPRPDSGLQMPVDFFFRSIAEEFGGNSIGVVLSGSASDGTLGLKAIKAEGGITFAQKPETASFDGMPRSAIAAGCVDFVLSPSAIAQELVRISRHPYVTRPAEQQETASTQELERDLSEIFNMLRNASGVDFSFYKHGTIRRRIFRRMALLKLESTSDYVRQVRDDRTELDALFQDILINVTSFFREPPTFETLVSRIYPALLQNRAPDDTLRVWVPGCSTGEDVYSVAITLLEYL